MMTEILSGILSKGFTAKSKVFQMLNRTLHDTDFDFSLIRIGMFHFFSQILTSRPDEISVLLCSSFPKCQVELDDYHSVKRKEQGGSGGDGCQFVSLKGSKCFRLCGRRGKSQQGKTLKNQKIKKSIFILLSRQNFCCCQVAHEPHDFLSFTHRDGRAHKDGEGSAAYTQTGGKNHRGGE